MEACSLDSWILASALVKLSSPGTGLFPVGRRRLGFQKGNLRLHATQLHLPAQGEARMALPEFPVEGGCQCGAVRYRLKASPLTVYNCHCKDCQRFTGAAWSMGMIVSDEDFEAAAMSSLWTFARTATAGSGTSRCCPASRWCAWARSTTWTGPSRSETSGRTAKPPG